MIDYKIKNLIESPPAASTKLLGNTKNRMDTFFYKRIFSSYAKEVIYKEAISAFQTQADDDEAVCIWQGEFWGKWVISGCEVYKACGDAELKKFLIKSAYEIISFAREDGYIGSYKDSMRVFATPEYINWNVWCRKYTLWGLLSCYEISQDRKILNAAARLARQLFEELAENGVALGDTGTFLGMPSCSILKPLLLLYRYTEEDAFFRYAEKIVAEFESPASRTPQMIENAIAEKPFHLWKEEPFLWAKIYEMTSCYEGIAEFYRLTGEEKYLRACEGYVNILETYEKNLVGTAGFNDMFANAAKEINAISEPCDAIHMMRLYKDLFQLTEKALYMDRFEEIFYNAFLAGVYRDGKWGARGVRGAGRHFYVESQAKFVHNHCCVNNMPRAFITMLESAVMCKKDGVLINLYEAMTFETSDVQITISDGYFTSGKVEIRVLCHADGQALTLRNPVWSDKTVLSFENSKILLRDSFHTLPLQKGESRFILEFDMTPKIYPFRGEITHHREENTRMYRRFLTRNHPCSAVSDEIWLEERRCTVKRGPLLLCKSKWVGCSEEEIFDAENLIDEGFSAKAISERASDCFYRGTLTFTKGKRQFSVKVCDYASAGSEKLSDDKYFNIYF